METKIKGIQNRFLKCMPGSVTKIIMIDCTIPERKGLKGKEDFFSNCHFYLKYFEKFHFLNLYNL